MEGFWLTLILWERVCLQATSCSASQKIPRILWTMFHFFFFTRVRFVINQMYSAGPPPTHFYSISVRSSLILLSHHTFDWLCYVVSLFQHLIPKVCMHFARMRVGYCCDEINVFETGITHFAMRRLGWAKSDCTGVKLADCFGYRKRE